VEVMACPGGCANGAGQPAAQTPAARRRRAECLRRLDAGMDLRVPKDNPFAAGTHARLLETGDAGRLLHTAYRQRRRIVADGIALTAGPGRRIPVTVCAGTSCHLRGSQKLLTGLLAHVEAEGLEEAVEVQATFCLEACDRGPTVRVAGHVLHRADLEGAKALLGKVVSGALESCEAAHACP
jgi:NADH-quinone oxidoreductase subunit G